MQPNTMLTISEFTPNVFDIKNAETSALKSELAKSIQFTAAHLVYLAAIWRELEERGENMSMLRTGLAVYLPYIANETLDAEVVVLYAGQTKLIDSLMRMSVSEQRRILKEGVVPVVKDPTIVNPKPEMKPLPMLSTKEVQQVFGNGRLRSSQEQIQYLLKESASVSSVNIIKRLKMDKSGEFILAGKQRIAVKSVLDLLGRYFNIDAEEALSAAAMKRA